MAQYLARYKIKELAGSYQQYIFLAKNKQEALTLALKRENELADLFKKPTSLEELAELIPILR